VSDENIASLEEWTPERERKARKRRKSQAEVVVGNFHTRHDIPPDRVIKAAIGQLDGVVVIGWDRDGQYYGGSNIADGGDVLWLLETTKHELLAKRRGE